MILALVEQIECLRLVIYKRLNIEKSLVIRSNIDVIIHDKKSKYEWLEQKYLTLLALN